VTTIKLRHGDGAAFNTELAVVRGRVADAKRQADDQAAQNEAASDAAVVDNRLAPRRHRLAGGRGVRGHRGRCAAVNTVDQSLHRPFLSDAAGIDHRRARDRRGGGRRGRFGSSPAAPADLPGERVVSPAFQATEPSHTALNGGLQGRGGERAGAAPSV
jgi:hypothetical protein